MVFLYKFINNLYTFSCAISEVGIKDMAKKLKKNKKGMDPKTKFVLVSAGKGIISNQSCIDGSKEGPWWVAAIFFVFSVMVPLIPGLVKNSKVNGGDFISSYNYGLDNSLSKVAYSMTMLHEDFKVEKDLLHYYQNDEQKDELLFETPDADYIAAGNQTREIVNPSTNQYELRIFVWEGLSTQRLSNYVNKVASQKYVIGTTTLKTAEDPKGTKYYTPNLLVLTHRTFAVALYKSNSTSQVQTSYGGLDWTNTSTKVGIIERLCKAAINDGAFEDGITLSAFVNTYHAKVLKQFRGICNEAYLNQKKRTVWGNFGIYAGIYAGIILFLGLMLFVLTRGKANPFRYLNIWHCQKIAWWAAFTPAILGMILAFVFSGNMIGQMAFILLISLRVMWLSMKQLRPVMQQQ